MVSVDMLKKGLDLPLNIVLSIAEEEERTLGEAAERGFIAAHQLGLDGLADELEWTGKFFELGGVKPTNDFVKAGIERMLDNGKSPQEISEIIYSSRDEHTGETELAFWYVMRERGLSL